MSEVFAFGAGGPRTLPPPIEVVGGKAWHLMQLASAGLPVPPGFVLPTAHCRSYLATGNPPADFRQTIEAQIRLLEQRTGQSFGGRRRPLLVSVRSGAAQSMPGMMDTLLDLGLDPEQEPAFLRATGSARLFWDSLRRLVSSFAVVVRGAEPDAFDRLLARGLAEARVPHEGELDVAQLRRLAAQYLVEFERLTGSPFPNDPFVQIREAVEAVWRSWQSPRAVRYRELHRLDGSAGTAVTVQAMVFGNRGGTSGSGVGFTRDPATGERHLYLDFLTGAQGEDVVSGRRTATGAGELAQLFPGIHADLERIAGQLERLFRDVQDFEFTVEQGQLWLLQSRPAKRTHLAALRIALALKQEGIITRPEAIARLAGVPVADIMLERVRENSGATRLAAGVPASPGVAAGPLALDAEAAVLLAQAGRMPILVRPDTSTTDLNGMAVACGVLTAAGSRTSHAALVARQLGIVAVVGCAAVQVDLNARRCRIGERWIEEEEVISIDGATGEVFAGEVSVERRRPEALLADYEALLAEESTRREAAVS